MNHIKALTLCFVGKVLPGFARNRLVRIATFALFDVGKVEGQASFDSK